MTITTISFQKLIRLQYQTWTGIPDVGTWRDLLHWQEQHYRIFTLSQELFTCLQRAPSNTKLTHTCNTAHVDARAVGYTCSSLTMEQPPFSSDLKVCSEHLRNLSNPTRISTCEASNNSISPNLKVHQCHLVLGLHMTGKFPSLHWQCNLFLSVQFHMVAPCGESPGSPPLLF